MPPQRILQFGVIDDDSKTVTLEGHLQDPFHDITVSLVLEKQRLRIVSALGRMDRVPYPEGCPTSLSRLDGVVDIEIRQGFSRSLRSALSGELGCPYLVELTEQICRFALVIIKSDEARQMVASGDDERFLLLRREMGQCAGHTLAKVDELPEWLKQEMKEKLHD